MVRLAPSTGYVHIRDVVIPNTGHSINPPTVAAINDFLRDYFLGSAGLRGAWGNPRPMAEHEHGGPRLPAPPRPLPGTALSPARLERVRQLSREFVDRGEMPMASVRVAQGGAMLLEDTYGLSSRGRVCH
jgi:hypothetical protein